MVKRQLTDSEKKLVNGSLVTLNLEMNWLSAQNELNDLQINTLLELNYKRTLANFKHQTVSNNGHIDEHKNAIKILNDQLANGVEVKEEVKEEVNNGQNTEESN